MSQAVANALYAASQYALVAVALTLTYSVARFLNFAQGAIFAVAAYSTYWFMQAGLSVTVAACGGVIAAAMVGIGFETAVFDRLRKHNATPLVALIAALGLLVVVQGVLSIRFGAGVQMIRPPSVLAGWNILGSRLTGIQIFATVMGFLLCGVTWLGLRYSGFGREFRAVASDTTLAKAVGVDVAQVNLRTTLLCSVLVSFAGIVAAYDVDLRPTMGFPPLLMGIVAMLTGGIGNLFGACAAALFLAVAQEVAVAILPTQWQQTIVFVILIGALFLRATSSFKNEYSLSRK